MDTLVEEALYTLTYNKEQDWIYIIWAGEPDLESIQRGCMDMLAAIKSIGCSKILNDARGVAENWTYASEWIGEVWFPLVCAAGLKNVAFVGSDSFECQLAIQLSIAYATNPPIAIFEDIEQARQWLASRLE